MGRCPCLLDADWCACNPMLRPISGLPGHRHCDPRRGDCGEPAVGGAPRHGASLRRPQRPSRCGGLHQALRGHPRGRDVQNAVKRHPPGRHPGRQPHDRRGQNLHVSCSVMSVHCPPRQVRSVPQSTRRAGLGAFGGCSSLRLFYGCSYMFHLSGNNRRDSHFMGS